MRSQEMIKLDEKCKNCGDFIYFESTGMGKCPYPECRYQDGDLSKSSESTGTSNNEIWNKDTKRIVIEEKNRKLIIEKKNGDIVMRFEEMPDEVI
ncbi:TPA_asm: hypothetical protein vir520_00029 [Caudoviricetes sp. vir520]|nr:TPA_asm: hypothetical protein vir520_00029 [Caudoviricetes sp. vir520]